MKSSVLFCLALVLLVVSCTEKPASTQESTAAPVATEAPAEKSAAGLPDLVLLDLDGKPFNLSTLGDRPVIVFFDPECDHCQRESKAIEARKKEFEGRDLYFVSIETAERVSRFRQEYKLTDPQFHFATGDLKEILEAMGPIPSVPCFYIYKDGRLAHRIEGEAEVDELLEKMK